MSEYAIGFDIGSSSVKASIVNLETRVVMGTTHYPQTEMAVISSQTGWAEQQPELWWENLCHASKKLIAELQINVNKIKSIGISYQMHGLVVIDSNQQVLRPAIIWSDSRAVKIGNYAFEDLGEEKCLTHLLNSPGNFTASKLKWVADNEPELFARVDKFLLPGDYIAMRMTGEVATTVSGLSEAILWDYKKGKVANFVLDYYGISSALVPEIVPTFAEHGHLQATAARQLGLKPETKVTYRAGDQPNNAMSLNVLQPGEIAATGGTSGVVYAVVDQPLFDPQSRVNGFVHVNHTEANKRIGVLLCINGAGSQYSWVRQQVALAGTSYGEMERMASAVPINSEGLRIIPFGNGAERILQNKEIGARIINLQLNRHKRAHFFRAALEGIAFSFVYGIEIINAMGISTNVIRVGSDNLFRSGVFSSTIAELTECKIEVMDTTGAIGAALASGVGVGAFKDVTEAVQGLSNSKSYYPSKDNSNYKLGYEVWKEDLNKIIENI